MRLGKTAYYLLWVGLIQLPRLAADALFPPGWSFIGSVGIFVFILLIVWAVERLHKRKGLFSGWVEERMPRLTFPRGAVFVCICALFMASLFLLPLAPLTDGRKFILGLLLFVCWIVSISLLESRWLKRDFPRVDHP
jgi:hypothetical protein